MNRILKYGLSLAAAVVVATSMVSVADAQQWGGRGQRDIVMVTPDGQIVDHTRF